MNEDVMAVCSECAMVEDVPSEEAAIAMGWTDTGYGLLCVDCTALEDERVRIETEAEVATLDGEDAQTLLMTYIMQEDTELRDIVLQMQQENGEGGDDDS